MKVLSVFAVVFSLLGVANVAMAQGYYDHQGIVTGSQANEAANTGRGYDYPPEYGR